MKKINQFFSSHGIKVIVIFLTFLYFRGCGTNSELSKVKKELKVVQTEIDSLNNTVEFLDPGIEPFKYSKLFSKSDLTTSKFNIVLNLSPI